jgi:hypothetical protein
MNVVGWFSVKDSKYSPIKEGLGEEDGPFLPFQIIVVPLQGYPEG